MKDIHDRLMGEAAEAGGWIEAIYVCPHDWDEGCDCRKPKPGLLFQAQRDHHLDLSRTFFIGDDERDVQAADSAGCPSMVVRDGSSLLDLTRTIVGCLSATGNVPHSWSKAVIGRRPAYGEPMTRANDPLRVAH